MKLVCESVDACGPNGEDLATKATYGEGIVGSEDYEYAESAIIAIDIDGKRYGLPEASFEKSHSRVWLWNYDEDIDEHVFDFFGSQALPDPQAVDLIDLKLDDLYENFDQDHQHLRKVHKFFNQQTLEWIKENPSYVAKYLKSHTATKGLLEEIPQNLELPDFTSSDVNLDICTLLCMFFEAFGISGYDPQKLSQMDEFEWELLDFETLTLGNTLLFKSLKESFCMQLNVINTVTFGDEENFQEMSHPSLADAIRFGNEILSDPDAAFNQQ